MHFHKKRGPAILVTLLMGVVSALYATAGQAGGSGFVAVMSFAAYPPETIRATAFALNIVSEDQVSKMLGHRRENLRVTGG
jgi:uncharacterized membrane protein